MDVIDTLSVRVNVYKILSPSFLSITSSSSNITISIKSSPNIFFLNKFLNVLTTSALVHPLYGTGFPNC